MGVTNTYKGKAALLSKPLPSLKLLSKPGNNCQTALPAGRGQDKAEWESDHSLQACRDPQSHLHCWAHLPRTGLLGPLLSAGTFLATIHSLGAEGEALLFSSGQK